MLVAEAATRTHDGTSSPSAALPAVGSLVAGRYRLTQVIGAGGMGTVYEAENVSTGRRCAVKFLGSGHGGRSRSAARFEREARTLARLEHEHVIAVLDFGWFEEQTPFIAMEYVRGQTLRQLLERSGPLEPQRALALLKQACRGMAHAHVHGVVHRDLKPENLMLTQYADGRLWLKVLDFGIARQLESEQNQLTPTGADLGTPHYMSPEQARGETKVDARADVYALGAILYEALTCQRVHAGSSYNEILFQVITRAHVPLASVLPGCPSQLSDVVERCLRKAPEERLADAGELLSQLEQIQLEPSAVDTASERPQPDYFAVAGTAPGLQRARRKYGLWPLAAAGSALVGLALGSLGAKLQASPALMAPALPGVAGAAPCGTAPGGSSGVASLPSDTGTGVASEPQVMSGPAAAVPLPQQPAPLPQQPAPLPRSAGSLPQRAASLRPAARARSSARTSPTSSGATHDSISAPSAPAPEADLPFATTNPYERP